MVEAKNADLAKGFTQLSAELIALDQWITGNQPLLLGAVTTGDIWQFGQLNRAKKQITQNTKLYVVPDDLETLMRILIRAILA
ncbi:MAG: hypothetical protein AAF215_03445 [Cyanobacteria bacterium P01_A01_bin.123]